MAADSKYRSWRNCRTRASSPAAMPPSIITMAYSPYSSEAPAPMATSVSMPGASERTPLYPEIKKARLIQHTGRVKASCTSAKPRDSHPPPSRKKGSGRPTMWPIVTYISGTRKHRLAISRRFSRGVSVSSSESSSPPAGAAP